MTKSIDLVVRFPKSWKDPMIKAHVRSSISVSLIAYDDIVI